MRPAETAALQPFFAPISRRSALIFAGALILLLAPWPHYGRVHAAAFSLFGNGVISGFGIGGAARPRFSMPVDHERGGADVDDWTVMLSFQGGDSPGPRIPLSTRILGYTPLAVFIALCAAAPMAMARRRKVVAIGAAILALRLAVAVALPVSRAAGQLTGEAGAGVAAEIAWGTFVDSPALSYVSPLVAWGIGLLVTAPSAPREISDSRRRRRKIGQRTRR